MPRHRSPTGRMPVGVDGTVADTPQQGETRRVAFPPRAIDPIGKGLRASIEGTRAGDVEVDATVTDRRKVQCGVWRRIARYSHFVSPRRRSFLPCRPACRCDQGRIAARLHSSGTRAGSLDPDPREHQGDRISPLPRIYQPRAVPPARITGHSKFPTFDSRQPAAPARAQRTNPISASAGTNCCAPQPSYSCC